MSRPLQLIDVFAGAGGLTRGFADEGFTPTAAVEHELPAAATYAENFGDHVQVVDSAVFARGSLPRADVVVGGPPCQGFSSIGARRAGDQRNQRWRDLVEVVRKTRPAFFVVENVPQFLESAAYRGLLGETRRGGALEAYRSVQAGVLNAADYGAPQRRRRAFVIGSVGPYVGLPHPTHAQDGREGLPPWRTLREALANLPDPRTSLWAEGLTEFRGLTLPGAFTSAQLHLTPPLSQLSARRYAAVPQGGSRFDLPDDLLAPCWRRPTRGSSDVMGRLHWDKPSVTLRTEFYKPEKGRFLHPSAPRALTLHEGALLQGFPDQHRWCGTRGHVARQIGNAVPVPLAAALARHLRRHLL